MTKTAKISIAAVLGVVAILVLLWDFGMFDSAPKAPPPPTVNMTPAEKVEFEKQQEQTRELVKKRPPSGA